MPKWWFLYGLMVIYHGRIRKQSPNKQIQGRIRKKQQPRLTPSEPKRGNLVIRSDEIVGCFPVNLVV